MDDLIVYLCSGLDLPELGLTPDEIEVGYTIIATAVPLMLMTCLLGFFCFAMLSAFNFLRGRRRDL